MRSPLHRVLIVVLLCSTNVAVLGGESNSLSLSTRDQLLSSLERGLDFLRGSQLEDGSWESQPGITGLAVLAFLGQPGSQSDKDADRMKRALDYLVGLVKPDGGIYDRDLPSYNTAVALRAFKASGDPRYETIIQNAQDFLVGLQADEGEGYSEDDVFYGGIGYGSDLRPDLSNLETSLLALKESGLPADHPVWERAVLFIQRCQNFSETNDQAWAGNDGGFVYYPEFSYAEAGGTQSYGSMTYAGLLSYTYANIQPDDERIKAAQRWIKQHYTVDENPGMGIKALYYYYLVFARALGTIGEDVLIDADGQQHNWREDLSRKLIDLQNSEGFWVNEDPSWWQNNKTLVTAFTSLAVENLLSE